MMDSQKSSLLPLSKPISTSTEVEPDDVLVVKRSLERLGFYRPPQWGLSNVPDRALIDGIRKFQEDQGLKIDGLINPEGETATALGNILTSSTPSVTLAAGRNKPTERECDHLYWNVDIPTCRAIEARRGKRSAARCYHIATARYAACLAGRPLDELPPLDIWNQ